MTYHIDVFFRNHRLYKQSFFINESSSTSWKFVVVVVVVVVASVMLLCLSRCPVWRVLQGEGQSNKQVNHHYNLITNSIRMAIFWYFCTFLHDFWVCNFPINPHIRLLVGRSVIISPKGEESYTSHPPFGALAFIVN